MEPPPCRNHRKATDCGHRQRHDDSSGTGGDGLSHSPTDIHGHGTHQPADALNYPGTHDGRLGARPQRRLEREYAKSFAEVSISSRACGNLYMVAAECREGRKEKKEKRKKKESSGEAVGQLQCETARRLQEQEKRGDQAAAMRDSQATASARKRDDQAAAMRDSQAIAERKAQARRSGGCNTRQPGDCKSKKEKLKRDGQAAAMRDS